MNTLGDSWDTYWRRLRKMPLITNVSAFSFTFGVKIARKQMGANTLNSLHSMVRTPSGRQSQLSEPRLDYSVMVESNGHHHHPCIDSDRQRFRNVLRGSGNLISDLEFLRHDIRLASY
jgi:hypothetical protein